MSIPALTAEEYGGKKLNVGKDGSQWIPQVWPHFALDPPERTRTQQVLVRSAVLKMPDACLSSSIPDSLRLHRLAGLDLGVASMAVESLTTEMIGMLS